MDEAQIIGYVVLAGISLGSFVVLINKFTQPINELKIVIQELKDCIKDITKDNDIQNKRLDRHRAEIECLQKDVMEIKHKIDMFHNQNN